VSRYEDRVFDLRQLDAVDLPAAYSSVRHRLVLSEGSARR
jgi:hypothetical protein